MPKRLLLIVVGLTLFSIVASLGGAFFVHDVLINGLVFVDLLLGFV